jgi:hypothetical protein
MLPRSSDCLSPNFHVGTGHRSTPAPTALPALAPMLLPHSPNEFPFDHPVMMTTSSRDANTPQLVALAPKPLTGGRNARSGTAVTAAREVSPCAT